MARQTATTLKPLELRVGDPRVYQDGRRGRVALTLPVPEELGGWFREKDGLRVFPLQGTGVWVYLGDELLVEPAPAETDESPELPPPMNDATAARRAELQTIEIRLATVREQVEGERARLARAQAELAELQPRLEAERARHTAELHRLDAELAAYRQAQLQARAMAMADATNQATMLGEVTVKVGERLLGTVDQIGALVEKLNNAEASAASSAATRKLEAQVQTTSTLSMLQDLENAGVRELVRTTEPKSSKISDGVGKWINDGGIDKALDLVENIFDRVFPPRAGARPSKPPAGE